MKKLLSILASAGLVATASSATVACSSQFASGSLTIQQADDLKINYDAQAKHGLLDTYVEDHTNWRDHNNSLAGDINKALNDYNKDSSQTNLDALNAAAYNVVFPIFKANGNWSLDPQKLYDDMKIDQSTLHDKATNTNKLELKTSFIKLGDVLHVLGVKDDKGNTLTNLADVIEVNFVSKDSDKNTVTVRGIEYLKSTFGSSISNESLQKIMNRPNKVVKGLKVEITTQITPTQD